jgi:hypothetical protein
MRDHEIELISALVEGRLDDESEARALIASSVELQAEYEAQKKAREALVAVGAALMQPDERAALHRDLWTALTSDARPSRAPWYYRWVPVTAGLLVVLVLGTLIVGGQGDTSVDTAAIGAAAESAETTTAAATATTEAASAETTEAMSDEQAAAAPDDGAGRVLDQLDTRLFADANRALRREGADLALAPASSAETAVDLDECLDEAGVHDVDVLGTIDSASLAELSGDPVPENATGTFIIAVLAGDDLKTASSIFFVDSGSCQLVYTGQ